jgi:hypothetical protein
MRLVPTGITRPSVNRPKRCSKDRPAHRMPRRLPQWKPVTRSGIGSRKKSSSDAFFDWASEHRLGSSPITCSATASRPILMKPSPSFEGLVRN